RRRVQGRSQLRIGKNANTRRHEPGEVEQSRAASSVPGGRTGECCSHVLAGSVDANRNEALRAATLLRCQGGEPMNATLSTTAWVLHDLGLATSVGGAVFGKAGLRPSTDLQHATNGHGEM